MERGRRLPKHSLLYDAHARFSPKVIRPSLSYLGLGLLAAFFSGACLLDSGSASPQEVVSATTVAIPKPTARPPATPSPTPAPTPVTNLSQSGAEALVWSQVRPCADQIVLSDGSSLAVAFDSTYSVEDEAWLVEASSEDTSLSFGRWKVADASGLVTPMGETAGAIASEGVHCAEPRALLAGGLTPPLFPTSTPTVVPSRPTPTPTAQPPGPMPTPAPAVANGEQARLRVWVAARSCFNPLPAADVFTAYRDQSKRWIVEGRREVTTSEGETRTLTYGLWFVDVDTGEITPSDQLAKASAANTSCFKIP